MKIYVIDIIFSAIIAALIVIMIEVMKSIIFDYPVLSTRYKHQKYEYCIMCDGEIFYGYSNTMYSPAEIARYAIYKLRLSGILVIIMSETRQE